MKTFLSKTFLAILSAILFFAVSNITIAQEESFDLVTANEVFEDFDEDADAPAEPVVVEKDNTAHEVAVLEKKLKKKDAELERSQKEIEYLKSMVEKILESNRREKFKLYYNLGYVYFAVKQYDKAEAEYKKALAINSSDPSVHYNMAILYDDGFKNKGKAVRHYRKFLEVAPNDKDAPRVKECLMAAESE